MAFCGLWIDDLCFELLAGETSFGSRRPLDEAAVTVLKGFAGRYERLCRRYDAAAALALGRDLFRWLDGGSRALGRLCEAAPRPCVFEVRGPRAPSEEEWALLRAPFELLAGEHGLLAGDVRLQFAPARRLGSAAKPPPLSDHRLGLAFMAAAPRGQRELGYEAEESAILAAVTPERIDLVVEESGNPEELGVRLAHLERMQALHLSCHGLNRWRPPGDPQAAPRPVLMMETLEGDDQPTDAAALIDALAASRPRFVFLSACLSAATADQGTTIPGGPESKRGDGAEARGEVAHSLATALIDAGLAAVLGWDGSVADRAATLFARGLYADLSRRVDLTLAVAAARRTLLQAEEEVLRHDWHLARLWLGPEGGGPVVGGTRKRSLLPASHGYKVFLDAKHQVPVAAPEMFVGRRRQIQAALREFHRSGATGVLIHGMGRLGKSSLAARLANRLQDRMAIAVVFEHYGALAVVEALEQALRAVPAARDLLCARKPEVREAPERLEALLTDLLSGPCAQAVEGQRPVLLIIDDLERVLEADPAGGRHRVEARHAPVLAMVLRAFASSLTDSRLLLTSRFPFVLDGLEGTLHPIALPPLSDTAQHKLQRRQIEAIREGALGEAGLAARVALLPRVRAVARGNPGLQDLIGLKLVLSREVPVARAEAALGEMEAWLEGGDLPDEPAIRDFLEDLTLRTLLDLAGPAGRALLQGLTLFQVPVPAEVAEAVARELGGSVARLRDLGLLDVLEDLVDARTAALTVNGLARAGLEPLSAASEAALAVLVVEPLFTAWGGDDGRRPAVADLELTRLACAAGHAAIVAACGNRAMVALEGGPAPERAAFGQRALGVLERAGVEAPWLLLSHTAMAAAEAGEGETADRLLGAGVAALERRRGAGEAVDPFEAGFLLLESGKRLRSRGELDRAVALFEEAAVLAGESGRAISVAIARSQIADILVMRGDLDAALRIRTEEEL
uniref:CHAT domain-containing protein n=1 Tax=Azospirillum brasilense TaxID=192 RepID=UPI000E0C5FCD